MREILVHPQFTREVALALKTCTTIAARFVIGEDLLKQFEANIFDHDPGLDC